MLHHPPERRPPQSRWTIGLQIWTRRFWQPRAGGNR